MEIGVMKSVIPEFGSLTFWRANQWENHWVPIIPLRGRSTKTPRWQDARGG